MPDQRQVTPGAGRAKGGNLNIGVLGLFVQGNCGQQGHPLSVGDKLNDSGKGSGGKGTSGFRAAQGAGFNRLIAQAMAFIEQQHFFSGNISK